MTQRIKVSSQTHTTNVFSGHITDELTGTEQLTRTQMSEVTFQRFRIVRAMIGTGNLEWPLDAEPVEIPADEYELFDRLQDGLPHSTESKPYTFIWRIPEHREPFFPEAGAYIAVFRFHPRDAGEVEKLTLDVAVT